jgi:hypothetical protein
MPEGFEKTVPSEGLADLLQFLTRKGKYLPLDLRKVAKDVPGSKLPCKLGGQQVRYLTVVPKKKETIARIDLVKGSDRSAPIVLAATVEGLE